MNDIIKTLGKAGAHRSVPIGFLKAHLAAIVAHVRHHRKPFVVTHYGEKVAILQPIPKETRKAKR